MAKKSKKIDCANIKPQPQPAPVRSRSTSANAMAEIALPLSRQERRLTYGEKLRDPRWQKRSAEIKARDNWACVDCGSTSENLQVDHAWYLPSRDPWDYPDEALYTRCASCHGVMTRARVAILMAIRDRSCTQVSRLAAVLDELADVLGNGVAQQPPSSPSPQKEVTAADLMTMIIERRKAMGIVQE